MKNQFSIIFTTILIISFLIGIIILTSIFSSLNLYNYAQKNEFSYSQDILYDLFSPNCLGYPSYPLYYTTYNKLEYFTINYQNELPTCAIFPYPFRASVGNYTFGILNFIGNCEKISYPISVNFSLNYINIIICENFYSNFYYFVYNFCLENESSAQESFVFLFPTNISGNEICTTNYNGEIICNIVPCHFVNSITLYQSVDVYLVNLGNGNIKIA
ncbi:hypothetical protein YN1_4350 [Nanoarchaeota archaeon]